MERFEQAIAILASDPYNKSGKYAIKKLVGVVAGDGQYRMRSGRFRLRYDVGGPRWCYCIAGCGARIRTDFLKYSCFLRSENPDPGYPFSCLAECGH